MHISHTFTLTYDNIHIFVYNIDIICIQEHTYYQRELEIKYDIGKGWTFISASAWKQNVNDHLNNLITNTPQHLTLS